MNCWNKIVDEINYDILGIGQRESKINETLTTSSVLKDLINIVNSYSDYKKEEGDWFFDKSRATYFYYLNNDVKGVRVVYDKVTNKLEHISEDRFCIARYISDDYKVIIKIKSADSSNIKTHSILVNGSTLTPENVGKWCRYFKIYNESRFR